jgi:hypothetical protein
MKKITTIILSVFLTSTIYSQVVDVGVVGVARDGDKMEAGFVKVNEAFQDHSDSLLLLFTNKANLASPVFTGYPKWASDTLATRAYVRAYGGGGGGGSILTYSEGDNIDIDGSNAIALDDSVTIASGDYIEFEGVKFLSGSDFLYVRDSAGNNLLIIPENGSDGFIESYNGIRLENSGSNTYEGIIGFEPITAPSAYANTGQLYMVSSDSSLRYKTPGNVEYNLLAGGSGVGDFDSLALGTNEELTFAGDHSMFGSGSFLYIRDSSGYNTIRIPQENTSSGWITFYQSLLLDTLRLYEGSTNVGKIGFEPINSISAYTNGGQLYAWTADSSLRYITQDGTVYNLLEGTTYTEGVGIDVTGSVISLDDSLNTNHTIQVADGNYFKLYSTDGGIPGTSGTFYFAQDSMRLYSSVDGEGVGITISDGGIIIDNDSLYLPDLAGTYTQWVGINSTGTLFSDSLVSAGKGLTMKLEPIRKHLYDRKDGEVKMYYLDENKELTYKYGIHGSPTETVYQLQAATEINLRYIARLQAWLVSLSIIVLLLFGYIIYTKRK